MRAKLIVGFSLLAIVGLWFMLKEPSLRNQPRKQWKESALTRIKAKVANTAPLKAEIGALRQKAADGEGGPATWLTEDLILMRNGDWVVYASQCRKADKRIQDIFLGRGSDEKWYYSSYHFCVDMNVLRMAEQPESLESLVQTCSLRTFDGLSDECLQKTWFPSAEEAKKLEHH